MLASLSAELRKLRGRPATWLIAGVWLALSVVFGYLFPYLSYRGAFSGAGTAGTPAELVLAEALPGRLAASAIQGSRCSPGRLR
jgi:ABC-2 type transport system permease protein